MIEIRSVMVLFVKVFVKVYLSLRFLLPTQYNGGDCNFFSGAQSTEKLHIKN